MPSAPAKQKEPSELGPTSPAAAPSDSWPQLPTETELYILPDGQVVVADLPVELQSLLATLGRPIPSEIEPPPPHD